MTTSFLSGALLAALLLATSLGAQERTHRPDGWPDAPTVLERYKAGERTTPYWHVVGLCPSESPYGDTLWNVLLAERPTAELTDRLAVTWMSAIRKCVDPRISAWYRKRLVQYRHRPFIALSLFAGLRHHPTPENLEAIKQHAFDESVDERHRSTVLFYLDWHWTWEEKLELFFETYRRTRPMPEPYGGNMTWNFMNSPVADAYVRGALEHIERAPEGPNPARLLHRLANHPDLERRPAQRAQVEEALARIVANPSGRYPEVLVVTARAACERLRAGTQP